MFTVESVKLVFPGTERQKTHAASSTVLGGRCGTMGNGDCGK